MTLYPERRGRGGGCMVREKEEEKLQGLDELLTRKAKRLSGVIGRSLPAIAGTMASIVRWLCQHWYAMPRVSAAAIPSGENMKSSEAGTRCDAKIKTFLKTSSNVSESTVFLAFALQ
jgi:hypothetical protein